MVRKTDTTRRELKTDELKTGSYRRAAALSSMGLLAVLGALLLVVVVPLWCDTLENCLRTHILPVLNAAGTHETRDGDSGAPEDKTGAKQPESEDAPPRNDWQRLRERLVSIDISSVSAMIVVIFSVCLAWFGIRLMNLLLRSWRYDKEFWNSAYDRHVFPSPFASFCIHLGLLGTLGSMALAAFGAVGSVSGDISEPLSSQAIFSLLCASLFSTLTGCFCAYVVIPPIEWINSFAMGRHQVMLQETGEEEFHEEIATATEKLGAFSAVLDKIIPAAVSFQDSATLFKDIREKITAISNNLSQSASRFDTLLTTASTVSDKLDHVTDKLQRVANTVDKLSGKLDGQLDVINSASSRLAVAQDGLTALAGSLKEPLGLVARVINTSLGILSDVKNAVQGLATGQQAHNTTLENMCRSVEGIVTPMEDLLEKVNQLVPQSTEHDNNITEQIDELKTQLDNSAQKLQEQLDGISGAVEQMHSQRLAVKRVVECTVNATRTIDDSESDGRSSWGSRLRGLFPW